MIKEETARKTNFIVKFILKIFLFLVIKNILITFQIVLIYLKYFMNGVD